MTRDSDLIFPFVEAAHRGEKQKPTAIILKASHTESTTGAALAIAHYWHRKNNSNITHYVLDSGSTYRCLPDHTTSANESAFRNGSIWVTLCLNPTLDDDSWSTDPRASILRNASDLVADLCVSKKIRPVLLSSEEQGRWYRSSIRRRSRGGIINSIPGIFPEIDFINSVRSRIEKDGSDG